jgi:hypothetical protein
MGPGQSPPIDCGYAGFPAPSVGTARPVAAHQPIFGFCENCRS